MHQIDRTAYRELDLILWDIHDRFVSPHTAFEMYEKRWGFVEYCNMSEAERKLIKRLTVEFGNEHFMPAV